MKIITSRQNDMLKRFLKLSKSRTYRRETGLFAIEGVRLCEQAAQAGILIEEAYFTPEVIQRQPDRCRAIMNSAVQTITITPQIAEKISETSASQGVFAVCRMLDRDKAATVICDNECCIALASLQDPGNVGSILRCASAFGIDRVIIGEGVPDVYSPKVLRASMGAVFSQNIVLCDRLRDYLEKQQSCGIRLLAAMPRPGAHTAGSFAGYGGCVVVMGNEGNGIPQEISEICESSIYIPISESCESLGVASAAAVLMWEMKRSRI